MEELDVDANHVHPHLHGDLVHVLRDAFKRRSSVGRPPLRYVSTAELRLGCGIPSRVSNDAVRRVFPSRHGGVDNRCPKLEGHRIGGTTRILGIQGR